MYIILQPMNWSFYYDFQRRQDKWKSKMTSTEDTVGFGEKQIDPWCKAKWDLIELIDSDKEILREVLTLSASKISLPDQMKVIIEYCLNTFAMSFYIEMNWRKHVHQLKKRSLLKKIFFNWSRWFVLLTLINFLKSEVETKTFLI